MAFGRPAGDARVYEYGVSRSAIHKGIMAGRDEAIAEMRRRVALWNRLVEIEREYRENQEAILGLALVVDGKKQRRTLTEAQREQLRALDDATRETVNEACRNSGCYWCNYNDVKVGWMVARKGRDPLRFHSWRNEDGKITTYLVRGLPVEQAYGEHGFLQIEHPNPRYPRDAIVRMRIGSTEDRQPVWLSLPVVMHRPLPDGCRIKSVSALRERLANQERWKVVFVLERDTGTWATMPGIRTGTISLDIGWRKRPHGLRVATWRNDDGETGELALPQRYLDQRATVERLEGHRQRLFNETLAALRAWLDTIDRPDWLREATTHIHQWRRPGRLVRLLRDWQRFRGDEAIRAMLDAYAKRDLHLWQYEANLRDQCLRWRREIYRCWVAEIVGRYERVVIEEFDLSRVAQVKDDGKGNELVEKARYYRQIAGVYQLRLALSSACKREGVPVEKLPAAYTTMECSVCGNLEEWDHRQLRHECSGCGVEWDQDVNAAENLLVGAAR